MLAKKDIIGVDLGFHSVKVVQVVRARGGSRVKRFLVAPTGFRPGMDPATLGAEWSRILQQLLKDNNLKPRFVATAIPGRYVFVKQLRVPAITGERLERIIAYEAKQLIPFPLEQLLRDFHVFPSTPTEHEVTLIAIKRETVEDRVSILQDAGLQPDVIDVAPLCLFNAFHRLEGSPEEVVALVDIGASTTDIVIQQGRVLKFPRSAPVGGNSLTTAVANAMGVDFDEAEQMKITSGSVSPEAGAGKDIQDVLSANLDKGIATEIRRSFDFFIAQPEGLAVNRVFICGGTARLKGIVPFLEERLGIPVEHVDPIVGSGLSFDTPAAEGVGDVAAVALGLGLRENPPPSCVALNFIPPRIVQQRERRKQRPVLAVAGVLIALLAGMVYFYLKTQIGLMRIASDKLWSDISLDRTRDPEWKSVLQTEKDLSNRFETLNVIGQLRGAVSRVFQEIVTTLPSKGVAVKDMRISSDSNRLRLAGSAMDHSTIDQMIRDLRRLPYFNPIRIKLDGSPQLVQETGQLSFTIIADGIQVTPGKESEVLYDVTHDIEGLVQARWLLPEVAAPAAAGVPGMIVPPVASPDMVSSRTRARLTVYYVQQAANSLHPYANIIKDSVSRIIGANLKPDYVILQIVEEYSLAVSRNVIWDYETCDKFHKGQITFEEFEAQKITRPSGPGPGAIPGAAAGKVPGATQAAAPAGAASAAAQGQPVSGGAR